MPGLNGLGNCESRLRARPQVLVGGPLRRYSPNESMADTATPRTDSELIPCSVATTLRVNGRDYALELDPRETVLDVLRERLGLSGTKKGCDHGQCGACTVLVNGRRVNACLTLAVMHEGDEITTIEGVGTPERLHALQAAFVECDGFQCGYCTPGQICSMIAMLEEARAGEPSHVTADLGSSEIDLTDGEIRERMSGNICRCAAYPNILAAIRQYVEGVHEERG